MLVNFLNRHVNRLFTSNLGYIKALLHVAIYSVIRRTTNMVLLANVFIGFCLILIQQLRMVSISLETMRQNVNQTHNYFSLTFEITSI